MSAEREGVDVPAEFSAAKAQSAAIALVGALLIWWAAERVIALRSPGSGTTAP